MNLTIPILYGLTFAAGFYLLIKPEKVVSSRMLLLAWFDLGLSLIVTALAALFVRLGNHNGFSSGVMRWIDAAVLADCLSALFLGASIICLPFAVYPLRLRRQHRVAHDPVQRRSISRNAWEQAEMLRTQADSARQQTDPS